MKRYLLLVSLVACTDEEAAKSTLEKSGYTDIKLQGYDMFACGEDDATSTAFSAKNGRGDTVTGTVCCGAIFKGCTVRF